MEDHWQPIETAPDDEDLLLWCTDGFMRVAMKDRDGEFFDIHGYPVRNATQYMKVEPPQKR